MEFFKVMGEWVCPGAVIAIVVCIVIRICLEILRGD